MPTPRQFWGGVGITALISFTLGAGLISKCNGCGNSGIRGVRPIGTYEGLVVSEVDRRAVSDAYIIQNPCNPKQSISMDQYIKNKFKNTYDRKMEKLKLEKRIHQLTD